MTKARFLLCSILVLIALMPMWIGASHATLEEPKTAEDVVIDSVLGFKNKDNIADGNRSTFAIAEEEAQVTVSCKTGIAALYVEFDRVPQRWKLCDTAGSAEVSLGEYGFLHEFIDISEVLGSRTSSVTLIFPKGTVVADIYGFSEDVPSWVQQWEPPCEKTDLMLISSHSDDEQLFFAGVLPYYAGERNLKVQVVYIVQHFEVDGQANHQRPHEQLDGLWQVGVRNYPVMAEFPDVYSEGKSQEAALAAAKNVFARYGYSYDDFVSYITNVIRRFKPLVIVSHDLKGEYGHGTHVICATALTEAINVSGDANRYTDSAKMYGTWVPEKLYLHLYPENEIIMDFDKPLDKFQGKTAFEMTQEGFGCHKSQHWTWFYKWIYGTSDAPIKKASDIRSYSPCKYGLYYSSVGEDTAKDDFFENVLTIDQRQAKAEAEAAAREAERIAAEKAAAEKAEEERQARIFNITVVIIVVCVLLLVCVLCIKKRSEKSRKRN